MVQGKSKDKDSVITLRLEPEEKSRILAVMRSHGIEKWQGFIETLINNWIHDPFPTSDNSDGVSEISENKVHTLTDGGTRSRENYDPRNALLHDYLEEILESGIDWFIDGIVANLKCWGEMSRFVRRVDEQPARDAEAFREDVNAIFRRRLGSVTEHPSPYQQGNREEGKSTAKRTKGRSRP